MCKQCWKRSLGLTHTKEYRGYVEGRWMTLGHSKWSPLMAIRACLSKASEMAVSRVEFRNLAVGACMPGA